MFRLPASTPKDEVFSKLKSFQADDMQVHGGKVWAYVYDSGIAEVEEIATAAYNKYMNANALDFTVFPSLLRMENEIVATVAEMFSGSGITNSAKNGATDSATNSIMDVPSVEAGDFPAGTFTSGGTESIILAVKAARDYYRYIRPDVTQPEIILPITAHAAFHKAAHYLGLKAVTIPVNPATFRVDPARVEAAITPNTIMMVGSAVNYSHGVIDPIPDLAAIALSHRLWLHVDACIGGFLLHYFRKLGELVPDFDFSVPGVSSLSVDLHKYAYAAKGASVVLYRDKSLRQFEMYACTSWSGYPMINTTIQSTKSGGPLAACWAVMNYLGENGYLNLARKTLSAKQALLRGLDAMPDVRVLGTPEAGLVAFTSDVADVFQLADDMKSLGWYVQVQPGHPDTPEMPGLEPSLHLTITGVSDTIVKPFLNDLAAATHKFHKSAVQSSSETEVAPESVSRAGATAPSEADEMPDLLAQLSQVDLDSLPPEVLQQLFGSVGIEPGKLPEDMAEVNRLLRLLPPALTEQLFITITSDMFTPNRPTARSVGGNSR